MHSVDIVDVEAVVANIQIAAVVSDHYFGIGILDSFVMFNFILLFILDTSFAPDCV